MPRPAVKARRLLPATNALVTRHLAVDADPHTVLSHPECPSLTAADIADATLIKTNFEVLDPLKPCSNVNPKPDPNTVTTDDIKPTLFIRAT
jgi:hypothetical protein